MAMSWSAAFDSQDQTLQRMLAQRQMEQNSALQLMQAKALLEQRQALADDRKANTEIRQGVAADRMVETMDPGDALQPDQAEILNKTHRGNLVKKTPATLESVQGVGMTPAAGGQGPSSLDMKTVPGAPASVTYKGTPKQNKQIERDKDIMDWVGEQDPQVKQQKGQALQLKYGVKILPTADGLQHVYAMEDGNLVDKGGVPQGSKVLTPSSTMQAEPLQPGPGRDAAIKRYVMYGVLPPFGRGGIGSPAGKDFFEGVGNYLAAEAAAGRGDKSDVGANAATQKALASTLQKTQTMYTAVNTSAKIADRNLELALQSAPKVSRTDSQWINSHVQKFLQGATSQPDLTDFEVKIYTAAREYAKVSTGSSASVAELSAAATDQVNRLLNAAQSPASFQAAVQAMRDDMNNITTSNTETIAGLQAQLRGIDQSQPQAGGGAHQAAAAPQGQMPAPGSVVVDPNGNRYRADGKHPLPSGWKIGK